MRSARDQQLPASTDSLFSLARHGAQPEGKSLPAGVRIVEQGELQRMAELFTSSGTAMAIGVFYIYAVLVLLFHDFMA